MIKLKTVTILKYKSINQPQSFNVEENITVLVGMNESGKTSVLEAIAKTNYFISDQDFKFSLTHDYPRKERKRIDKEGVDPTAIECLFELSDQLIDQVNKDLGVNLFTNKSLKYGKKYSNEDVYFDPQSLNMNAFLTGRLGDNFNVELLGKLLVAKNIKDIDKVLESIEEAETTAKVTEIRKYFENKWGWDDPIGEYVYRKIISINIPKFLYYDEYFALPSKISIEKLQEEELDENELKTAKALFELADIDIAELINAEDFEDYKAELEATQGMISDELFKYWKSNDSIDIEFDIEKVIKTSTNAHNNRQDKIVEHLLNVRVKNNRTKVSLPLKNRSKGFNWFFSFLVWFKKIQEDKETKYILLLDEPGLNLHATAQADLLEFLEDLSKEYQILYTTHSPFMIDSKHLDRVRTVFEGQDGTILSDSIQEKDPNTLLPLQAALGYDIAQNLFIGKENLLVEGVADLIYLTIMSDILKKLNREGLKEGITIVPVGGLDKVSTFISLLRGSKLNIVCLLDSFVDAKGKSKVEDLIQGKIIRKQNIKYYDEFTELDRADVEDLFEKEEFLKLFNSAFPEFKDIQVSDLNPKISNIILQINQSLGQARFNHYRPANQLAKLGIDSTSFTENTLKRFEHMFQSINSLFQ